MPSSAVSPARFQKKVRQVHFHSLILLQFSSFFCSSQEGRYFGVFKTASSEDAHPVCVVSLQAPDLIQLTKKRLLESHLNPLYALMPNRYNCTYVLVLVYKVQLSYKVNTDLLTLTTPNRTIYLLR